MVPILYTVPFQYTPYMGSRNRSQSELSVTKWRTVNALKTE